MRCIPKTGSSQDSLDQINSLIILILNNLNNQCQTDKMDMVSASFGLIHILLNIKKLHHCYNCLVENFFLITSYSLSVSLVWHKERRVREVLCYYISLKFRYDPLGMQFFPSLLSLTSLVPSRHTRIIIPQEIFWPYFKTNSHGYTVECAKCKYAQQHRVAATSKV